jgi:hypothetical protein
MAIRLSLLILLFEDGCYASCYNYLSASCVTFIYCNVPQRIYLFNRVLVFYPFVPRKHWTRFMPKTSLCLYRTPVNSYSTRPARLIGPLIICLTFLLAVNNLVLNRDRIQVGSLPYRKLCVRVPRTDRTRRFPYCRLQNIVQWIIELRPA